MIGRTETEERVAAELGRDAALARMAVPKNRAKGTWHVHSLDQLLTMAAEEVVEALRAVTFGEGDVRVEEEIGDALAALCQALDVLKHGAINGAPERCTCCGCHIDGECCPGWCEVVVSDGTLSEDVVPTVIQRCDACATFETDEDARAAFEAFARADTTPPGPSVDFDLSESLPEEER